MATIQVVLDEKLLKATNSAAKHAKQNRSELVRTALREFLHKEKIREMEERDRRGYERIPEQPMNWRGKPRRRGRRSSERRRAIVSIRIARQRTPCPGP